MLRRPPRSTLTDTLCPDTTLFRSQRREQGGHARRHPIEPAFPVVLFHTFYSLQIALRGDGCGHRSRVRAEQPAREGGSGNLREWCGGRLAPNPPPPFPLLGGGGRERPSPSARTIMPTPTAPHPSTPCRSCPPLGVDSVWEERDPAWFTQGSHDQ